MNEKCPLTLQLLVCEAFTACQYVQKFNFVTLETIDVRVCVRWVFYFFIFAKTFIAAQLVASVFAHFTVLHMC